MVLTDLLKINLFLVVVALSPPASAETAAANHLAKTPVGAREVFLPEIPEAYYIPYQKYVSATNQKYLSPAENQIPIGVSSTEKPIASPSYKLPLTTPKYVFTQPINPPQSPQGGHVGSPYLYTIAPVISSTTTKYPTSSRTQNDFYEEVPKKYHYGYRVSNPHTGAEFGHSEVNDGISARGYYHVLLPDGRLQNVKYWAGPSGYHATITYETQY